MSPAFEYTTSLVLTEFDLSNELIIYPNPVKDFLNLDFTGNLLPARFKLYNSQGQIVLQGKLNASQNLLDLQQLANGTYTLVVTQEKRKSNVKIVKQL
jgi:hypothetical protein